MVIKGAVVVEYVDCAIATLSAPLPILNQTSIVPRLDPTRGPTRASTTPKRPLSGATKVCPAIVGKVRRGASEFPRHDAAPEAMFTEGVRWRKSTKRPTGEGKTVGVLMP